MNRLLVAAVTFLALITAAAVPCPGLAQGVERSLVHQGIERRYTLDRPATAGPLPLIVSLHPLTRARWMLFDGLTSRETVAIAAPQAIDGRWSYWRGGGVMLPGHAPEEIDDVGFAIAMVDQLISEGVADPARIFLAGASRGALLAWTMACTHPTRFAAVAPLLSGMIEPQVTACPPGRAVPIIAVAGTADPVQPYDGSLVPSAPRLLSIPETMEFWRRRHGCTGQTFRELPHKEAPDPTRTQVVEWTGCSDGPVLLYKLFGGGHRAPMIEPDSPDLRVFGRRNRDFNTPDELWRVFRTIRP